MTFNVGDFVFATEKGIDGAQVDVGIVYKINQVVGGVCQLILPHEPIDPDLERPTWVNPSFLISAGVSDYLGILEDLLTDLEALEVYDMDCGSLVSYDEVIHLVSLCRTLLKQKKEN